MTADRTAAANSVPCAATSSPYLSPAGAALSLAAAVLLCWPMLLTSAPLVYFDTLSYYTNGEEIWSRVLGILASFAPDAGGASPAGAGADVGGVPTAAAAISFRSLPYSAWFYPLAILPAGLIVVCIVQTAMTLWVFLGLCPPLTAQARRFAIAAFAAVGTLTTLPWFASYALPDILGAVLPVYFALALGHMERMGRIKLIVLMAIATFAMLSHYGHLPLALVLAVGIVLWRIWNRRLTAVALTFCLLPVVLAFAINLASSIILSAALGSPAGAGAATVPASQTARAAPPLADREPIGETAVSGTPAGGPGEVPQPSVRAEPSLAQEASFTPNRIPVLLARSIQDGPGRWYLEEECRERDRYAVCEVFDEIPDTVYEFLWADSGLRSATPEQLARIRAQETEIVFAAARRYPLRQATALAANTLEQTVRIGTGELLPLPTGSENRHLTELRPRTADNEADAVLRVFDWITPIATAMAFLVLAWRMATGRTQHFLTEAIVVILLAMIVNAAVFGGLSAPVDRYQSRIAWLIPALLALDLTIARMVGRNAELGVTQGDELRG